MGLSATSLFCLCLCCTISTSSQSNCTAGWYGSRCDSRCSTRSSGCIKCEQAGGDCTACQDGYYRSGDDCVQCSSKCILNLCGESSSTCRLGCLTGWYGYDCDSRCSARTTGCVQCDQYTGRCTACQEGYYKSGSSCVRCSSNCFLRRCDTGTGKCMGCVPGRYGLYCDLTCSRRTSACIQCDQDGGQCTACGDGYYKSGSICFRCGSDCYLRLCVPDSGRCIYGCNAGWYGERCDLYCSIRIPGCSQCVLQHGVQCTACSGHFKPPECTVCEDSYYKSNSTCVQCSNCFNRQCDPDSGRCTLGCPAGFYGDTCVSRCSEKTPRCSQCVQDGGQCTACSGHFTPPQCTEPLEESLVGPVVGAVVGSIVGVGLIAIIVTAVLCWRLKSKRNERNARTVEMSSSAPVNNLSDSAITGSDTPPPASSRSGVQGSVYEITENGRDGNNGVTQLVAPPTASSSAGGEGSAYENETRQRNVYDRLGPYASDDRLKLPYSVFQ